MLLACLVYPKGGYSKFDLQPVSSHLRDEGSAIKYLWHITLAYDMMPMENDMSHHAEYDNIYLNIYDAFLNLSTILNLARKHKKAKHELKNILFSQHLTWLSSKSAQGSTDRVETLSKGIGKPLEIFLK